MRKYFLFSFFGLVMSLSLFGFKGLMISIGGVSDIAFGFCEAGCDDEIESRKTRWNR